MKRIAISFLALLLLLAACTRSPAPLPTATEPSPTAPEAPPQVQPDEIRAVWLSYFDLMLPAGGISEQAYREKYETLFAAFAAFGLNTLFVHVRPFTDAIYPSEIYPWSEILTGTQGKDPGYDPLAILCELAEKNELGLHAWFNPFRITPDHRDISKLDKGNPALPHIESEDGWVRRANNRYYWNPAVPETHALIYEGVRELLENYPLAGIHIDDYFYPTTDPAFDAAQYGTYQRQGGGLLPDEWRREMVSQFVAGLYRAVHRARPGALLSISPSANLEKNYEEHYADTARWMREPGFADWMVPQIYYGFQHTKLPFEATSRTWEALPRHGGLRLALGLAAYKTGQDDEFAGATARGEWQARDDILARQARLTRTLEGCDGFAIYSCTGLFGPALTEIAQKEKYNLQILITSPF